MTREFAFGLFRSTLVDEFVFASEDSHAFDFAVRYELSTQQTPRCLPTTSVLIAEVDPLMLHTLY